MSTRTLTIPEIRQAGFEAFLERLGPAGMIRFMQQFESGRCDYTKARAAWLDGLAVDEIAADIEKRRQT